MRRHILKILLFSIPFVLLGLVVVVVDPYNYFHISSFVDDGIKLRTSGRLNSHLWKALEFTKHPVPNVILGDSRSNSVSVDVVEEVTGKKYYNFAYGGGTIPEIVSTFWYAAEQVSLQNVYIGINFNLYNAFNAVNRFPEAEAIVKNPWLYFVNKTVLHALCISLYSRFMNRAYYVGNPPMSRDEFWRFQLNVGTYRFYNNYKYPDKYYAELKKIADYCHKNGVNLVLVTYPTHIDLQKRVVDFNLTDANKKFREDLHSLGRVIDMDYPNSFTRENANFDDPYHYKRDFQQEIVAAIWAPLTDCGENIPLHADDKKQIIIPSLSCNKKDKMDYPNSWHKTNAIPVL